MVKKKKSGGKDSFHWVLESPIQKGAGFLAILFIHLIYLAIIPTLIVQLVQSM